MTAITNNHKLIGLTQNTFVILRACQQPDSGALPGSPEDGPRRTYVPVFPISQDHPLSIFKAGNSISTICFQWSISPPTLALLLPSHRDSCEDLGPSLAPELSALYRTSLPW